VKGLDTNVLIRYLVQDDPAQSALATQVIEQQTTHDSFYLCHIVLCELVWVLESRYQQTRTMIVTIIDQLLRTQQLEVQQPAIVWNALQAYQQSTADFSDYLIAHSHAEAGCETTITFDKKAAQHPLFTSLSE
jgi:predicted nucleic-acid-binding protein